MGVESTLYTRLSGFTGLTNLVGTRIYPNIAPQGAQKPYIVFRRVTTQRHSAFGQDTGDVRGRFQFDIFADKTDYTGAKNVSEQVRLALQRWSTTTGTTIQTIFFVDEVDLFEVDPELQHLALDFEVHYKDG